MDESNLDYTNWAAGQPDGIVTRPVSNETSKDILSGPPGRGGRGHGVSRGVVSCTLLELFDYLIADGWTQYGFAHA